MLIVLMDGYDSILHPFFERIENLAKICFR